MTDPTGMDFLRIMGVCILAIFAIVLAGCRLFKY